MVKIQNAMKMALKEAWKYQLLTYPNPAVGAAVMCERGMVVSVGAHRYAGGPHAEVYALRDAYTLLSRDNAIVECEDSLFIHNYLRDNHRDLFKNLSIIITLEPCMHSGKTPSCASLLVDLGMKSIYYGSDDPNPVATGAKNLFKNIYPHILKDECDRLLEPFRLWQKRPFVLFKYASRLDGTFDNGSISSTVSKEHMHSIREKIDLLVIGGNSVRIDRPTLDSRMVGGRAPDIFIYSKGDDFDKTIPLFSVKNREVIISDDLSILDNYRFIMIEGGDSLYEIFRDKIDMVLCYMAAKFGNGNRTFGKIDEKFAILDVTSEEDLRIWMKKDG